VQVNKDIDWISIAVNHRSQGANRGLCPGVDDSEAIDAPTTYILVFDVVSARPRLMAVQHFTLVKLGTPRSTSISIPGIHQSPSRHPGCHDRYD
jgi:hypothetical protein